MPPTLLPRLPPQDSNKSDFVAVIETSKGSQNKYDYDDDRAAFRLAGVMPQGSWFPHDFGFIPSTLGEDGDPLDVLVFLDTPAPVGCVLTIRLTGAIEAKQRNKGGQWMRNDRSLAVATHAHIQNLDHHRPRLLDDIETFFETHNALNGKKFKPIARSGPNKARKPLGEGADAFSNRSKIGVASQAA